MPITVKINVVGEHDYDVLVTVANDDFEYFRDLEKVTVFDLNGMVRYFVFKHFCCNIIKHIYGVKEIQEWEQILCFYHVKLFSWTLNYLSYHFFVGVILSV